MQWWTLVIDGLSKIPWERIAVRPKVSEPVKFSIPGTVTVGEAPKAEELPEEKAPVVGEEGIKEGTACNICSDEHFSRASGALSEALRFAKDKGMKNPEVIRRIRSARDELNSMERFDLAPEAIVKLRDSEQNVARWALSHSRDLRHQINGLIAGTPDDLETVAAKAAELSDEFMRKVWELPQDIRESCPECKGLETLKEYLERRRKEIGS